MPYYVQLILLNSVHLRKLLRHFQCYFLHFNEVEGWGGVRLPHVKDLYFLVKGVVEVQIMDVVEATEGFEDLRQIPAA